jgi:hypothetical protein
MQETEQTLPQKGRGVPRKGVQALQAGLKHWGRAGPDPLGAPPIAAIAQTDDSDDVGDGGASIQIVILPTGREAKRQRWVATTAKQSGMATRLRRQTQARLTASKGARAGGARSGSKGRRDGPRPFRRRAWSVKRYLAIRPWSREYEAKFIAANAAYCTQLARDREERARRGVPIVEAPESEAMRRKRRDVEVPAARWRRRPVPAHMKARWGRALVAIAHDIIERARKTGGDAARGSAGRGSSRGEKSM